MLVLILIGCCGCSNTLADNGEQEEEQVNKTAEEANAEQDTVASYANFKDGSWLDLKHTAGNAKGAYYFMPETWGVFGNLAISNYRAGFDTATIPQTYNTVFITNRITKVSETLICITDPGETAAAIPIRKILHDNDLSSVKIKSFEAENVGVNYQPTQTLTGETLVATDYSSEDNTIWVEGFKPDYPRAMITTYTPDIEFSVECVFVASDNDNYVYAPEEIVNWVAFDKESYIVEPNSYEPVWVYLNVPEEVTLPSTWKFWIEVSMSSGKLIAGVSSVITVRVPVQVNMAQ